MECALWCCFNAVRADADHIPIPGTFLMLSYLILMTIPQADSDPILWMKKVSLERPSKVSSAPSPGHGQGRAGVQAAWFHSCGLS